MQGKSKKIKVVVMTVVITIGVIFSIFMCSFIALSIYGNAVGLLPIDF